MGTEILPFKEQECEYYIVTHQYQKNDLKKDFRQLPNISFAWQQMKFKSYTIYTNIYVGIDTFQLSRKKHFDKR